MSKLMLGAVCGLIWGALSAASMIPLEFSEILILGAIGGVIIGLIVDKWGR